MIPGEAKLNKQLNALQHLELTEVKLAVNKKIYEESQVLVPVDKGDLKRSGQYDEKGITYGDSYVDYALFQEFGTVYQTGTPYIRPAYENHRRELTEIAADEANKAVKEAID